MKRLLQLYRNDSSMSLFASLIGVNRDRTFLEIYKNISTLQKKLVALGSQTYDHPIAQKQITFLENESNKLKKL